jgi:hypothetical protein
MPAQKVVNYEDGSDARYDTSQMTPTGDGRLTDGTYYYDSEGRPLDAIPGGNEWTAGLPGARGGGSAPGGAGGGSALFGNPYYGQYQSAVQAEGAADLADTKAAIQQLLVQFGYIPGDYQDKLGSLDDTIRQLIAKNTESGISQYARMLEAKGDSLRETTSRHGASGLLRSGAKGHRLRRNQLDFDRNLSDQISALLANLNSAQGGYASRDRGRQMSLAQMLANISSTWRPTSSSGWTSTPRQYAPPPMPVFQSQAGPSPYQPVQNGTYTGGALYATPTENKNINPIFWFK